MVQQMKIALEYAGKTIYVSPYTTKEEKELLVFNEITEVFDIDGIMRILDDKITGDVEDLSENEKLAVSKNRLISIPNCFKKGSVRLKITRSKHNIFVGKVDPDGNWVKVINAGGPLNDGLSGLGGSIAIDFCGNPYILNF